MNPICRHYDNHGSSTPNAEVYDLDGMVASVLENQNGTDIRTIEETPSLPCTDPQLKKILTSSTRRRMFSSLSWVRNGFLGFSFIFCWGRRNSQNRTVQIIGRLGRWLHWSLGWRFRWWLPWCSVISAKFRIISGGASARLRIEARRCVLRQLQRRL